MNPEQLPGLFALSVIWDLRARDCQNCRLARWRTHSYPLIGTGATEKPEIAFVGEVPSKEDARVEQPFTEEGPEGRLLRTMIQKMGRRFEDSFITLATLCGPLQPGKSVWPFMRQACEPLLLAQIRAVRPKVVVALGEVAGRSLTGLRPPSRGVWYSLNQGGAATEIHADVIVTSGMAEMLAKDGLQARLDCWKHLQLVNARLRESS